ncbi:MAG: DUF1289 domain-containing protein [Spirochaetales bacterium]|nr:DUF1289 domain-containing protein [Leptospiraceae bacterium]MCP5483849.1 DUF1289 domain-containing protein [Spirochaetales bacterium]MCP5486858.1 DUF1289 domain-containing protein [Spirochaetales bacterium]
MHASPRQPSVESPCVGLCRLDESGLCVGCLRSLPEISAWPSMSEASRKELLALLERRKAEPTSCSGL